MLESPFNKIAGLKAFLRLLTLKNFCERLFLHHKYLSVIFTRSVAQLFLEQLFFQRIYFVHRCVIIIFMIFTINIFMPKVIANPSCNNS